MTVDELRKALADVDGGYEIKLSGDHYVMGNGNECRETHEAPGVSNVELIDGFLVLWPTCSWDEAMDHADNHGEGSP